MLDFNINLEFKPELGTLSHSKVDSLAISSCAIHLFSDDRIWSSFDEDSYNYLNNNNYGLGVIDFEIGLVGYTGVAYPKVYTKCFELRTDNNLRIKPKKIRNDTSESKINKRGEVVIGLRYFFKDEKEIEDFENCNRLMFEAFFALEKPKNTYAFMCQLYKTEHGWEAEYANTYRRSLKENIKWLVD
jgi:hypothetical protein